ncbi:uncharacterized protein KRP23_4968 [Phytophthora ramorum]|uniref:uncharacterized protein n=1 Tax=Phytophthora ramorum TaxID=164328 RepID=UPI0030B3D688|nr:hypothetical protein KRP23_4968 [Phytophthora ramorum]KAH7504390.1 hypothetical protein KRP22_4882 [Phytophthora ramorum]
MSGMATTELESLQPKAPSHPAEAARLLRGQAADPEDSLAHRVVRHECVLLAELQGMQQMACVGEETRESTTRLQVQAG